AGYHSSSKVVDVLNNDNWNWPIEWQDKYPMACSLTVSILDRSSLDLLVWRKQNDVEMQFSVATVWDTIRPRGEEVDWIFKKRKRSKEQVLELIMSIVRLNLFSCRFKKTSRVESFAQI
nr:hypothetical protein [Tanacetum cinerariifolium]